jgi:hypothetical protein
MQSRRSQKDTSRVHSDNVKETPTKGHAAHSAPREDVQIVLPSISTLLGQGRTDPFAASTTHDLSPLMRRILDYGEHSIPGSRMYASDITD